MAFQIKQTVYRPINAAEWKDIMLRRIKAALDADGTLNMMRSFPLFKYEISITLTPYRPQRPGDPPIADAACLYQCDGEVFVPVNPEAFVLEEESPIYGAEADPQQLRRDVGIGIVETQQTAHGELVDVRVAPRPEERAEQRPFAEPVRAGSSNVPQVPVTPQEREGGMAGEQATYAIEEKRWAGSAQDGGMEAALKERDPSLAPNRVSVVDTPASRADASAREHLRKRGRS